MFFCVLRECRKIEERAAIFVWKAPRQTTNEYKSSKNIQLHPRSSSDVPRIYKQIHRRHRELTSFPTDCDLIDQSRDQPAQALSSTHCEQKFILTLLLRGSRAAVKLSHSVAGMRSRDFTSLGGWCSGRWLNRPICCCKAWVGWGGGFGGACSRRHLALAVSSRDSSKLPSEWLRTE